MSLDTVTRQRARSNQEFVSIANMVGGTNDSKSKGAVLVAAPLAYCQFHFGF